MELEAIAAELGCELIDGALVFPSSGGDPFYDGRSYVYFIGGETGAIKIGVTGDTTTRLRQLQTGSPIKLKLLARLPGDEEVEKEYHHRFAASRLHGEWFERTPELMAEIDWLNEPEPDYPA